MQVPIPKCITVSLDDTAIRFTSDDAEALCAFAQAQAHRHGLRNIGAVRSTVLTLTPTVDNLEPVFGVPTPYRLFLISHEDLMFAGNREPATTTVYVTRTRVALCALDTEVMGDHCYAKSSYHFTLALK